MKNGGIKTAVDRLLKMRAAKLKKIPVTITGNWKHGGSGSDWRGQVTSSEPVVAISFLGSGSQVRWVRSDKSDYRQEVRITLSPQPEIEPNLHVNYGLQGVVRCWTQVNTGYMPSIPDTQTIETGNTIKLMTIEGDPVVELAVLFIARSDVKSYPKGIWHLRKDLIAGVDEPLATILTYARTGKLTWDDSGFEIEPKPPRNTASNRM